MNIKYKISGLPLEQFSHLFTLSNADLRAHHAARVIAESKPGFPCRVSLIEAEAGESLILLPYTHHKVHSPYCSSGPIYVRENATEAALDVGELPEVLRHRPISIRAYSNDCWMIASTIAEGLYDVDQAIQHFLQDPSVKYLHLHNAKPGCFSCRADRVE